MKPKDKFTIAFASVAAIITAIHAFVTSRQGQTFEERFIKAIIVFAIFIFFILAAYISSGRRWLKGGMIVSAWFGIFVAGSFFLFWFGGAYAGNLFYGGLIAVAIWGVVVLSIWGLTRIIKRQKGRKSNTIFNQTRKGA
jgi:hypothetical protein